MLLKFDEYIYQKEIEIQFKDEIFAFTVGITSADTEEIDKRKGENLDDILFKDNLERIKGMLDGYNYISLYNTVYKDFLTFMIGLTLKDAIKTTEQTL